LCNDEKYTYCLDFDIEFSKYHGPTDIAKKNWNGINDGEYKSPFYDMRYDVCKDKCYGNDDTCNDENDYKCVEAGKFWDYYEIVTGTFIGHPGTPWEGFKGKVTNQGHSTQRGYGANLMLID